MSRSRHPEITKATEGTNKNSPREPRGVSPASRLGQAPGSTPRHARLPAAYGRTERDVSLCGVGCGGPRRRLAFAKLRRAVPVPTRGSSRASQSPGGLGEEASRAAPRRLLRRPVAANGAYGSPSPDGWGGQEGAARCCLARPSTHRPTPRGTPLRAAACREAA